IVRAVGRQFDLVQRRQDLLVLVTETVGDVHIQGSASAGSRQRTAGAVRSASASGHDQQGERRDEKCARSSETLHTTYILSFWLRPDFPCNFAEGSYRPVQPDERSFHSISSCFLRCVSRRDVLSPGGWTSPHENRNNDWKWGNVSIRAFRCEG